MALPPSQETNRFFSDDLKPVAPSELDSLPMWDALQQHSRRPQETPQQEITWREAALAHRDSRPPLKTDVSLGISRFHSEPERKSS